MQRQVWRGRATGSLLDSGLFRAQYGRGRGETKMKTILIATILLIGLSRGAHAAAMGPEVEPWLLKVTTDYAGRYGAAANDMAKGMSRTDRAAALCAAPSLVKPSQGAVRDWTGTVAKLDSTGDGRGILYVKISPTVTLKTTNNSFSEGVGGTPTLIPARSPLFAAVVKLSVDQKVRFSGNFYPSVGDCLEEKSVTTEGSMTEPDFLFRFMSVVPIE